MINENICNTFWINDPSVLYQNNKYMKVLPTPNMSRVEQLNSLTRLCIYVSLFSVIFGFPDFWYHAPIVIIIFLVVIYYMFEHNKENNESEHKSEHMSDSVQGDIKNKDKSKKHKYVCRKPTPNNPFMNDTFDDLQQNNPPQACNVDDDDVKYNMVKSFNDGLFRDVSDLYERENSQREFYTIPRMHPNDQTAFAKWCYGDYKICKTDPKYCLKYENLRHNR